VGQKPVCSVLSLDPTVVTANVPAPVIGVAAPQSSEPWAIARDAHNAEKKIVSESRGDRCMKSLDVG
jgi:hypothetical protein